MLLGSAYVKAVRRLLMKLSPGLSRWEQCFNRSDTLFNSTATPGNNFSNVLQAAFVHEDSKCAKKH